MKGGLSRFISGQYGNEETDVKKTNSNNKVSSSSNAARSQGSDEAFTAEEQEIHDRLHLSFHAEFGEDQDLNGLLHDAPRSAIAKNITSEVFTRDGERFSGIPPLLTPPDSFVFNVVKKTNEYIKTRQATELMLVRHNKLAGKITLQKDVPYLTPHDGDNKHMLDIYYPEVASANSALAADNVPIVIHFHGGGWLRGDRADEFRGAPSACREYAGAGMIAVAPSYTLGDPRHMEDAVAAVTWVVKHASRLGGDPRGIFVSGHSAGGNIAANLVIGDWLNEVLLEYNCQILGAVCMSGVYSLIKPLGGSHYIMNKAFDKMYRIPTFGHDIPLIIKHCPVYQLRMRLGEPPYEKSTASIVKTKIAEFFSSSGSSVEMTTIMPPLEALRPNISFLVMNAQEDLGLDNDGVLFSELLRRSIDPMRVRYERIEEETHASVAISGKSLGIACMFITETHRAAFHAVKADF